MVGLVGGWQGVKINDPWNRGGGEGRIFCKSYCVCWGGGGGGSGGRIRILPLVFMFQKCSSFWGPSSLKRLLPITLSFLDSVLYEI